MADRPVITALFPDRASAERAYQMLSDRGYRGEDINLVMSDDTRERHFGVAGSAGTGMGSKAAEGAGIGAGVGGALGAAVAAVAAIGTTLALPGLGLVIAGPLAAGLAGAGAGGAAGSLLGALIGWGIPQERVDAYASGIREGAILMGVRARDEQDARMIEQSWREARAADVHRAPGQVPA